MPPAEPKFPNPPLVEIDPKDLVTADQVADQFGVKPGTIRVWGARGKIAPVIPGSRSTPALYHLPTLSRAEKDAYRRGAHRPGRGGRHPDWKPCTAVPERTPRAA